MKKTKKIILLLIVIAIVILLVIAFSNKKEEEDQEQIVEKLELISEFDNLKAKNVELTYNEEEQTTYLTYKIENTSDNQLAGQTINLLGLDETDSAIVTQQIYIDVLEPRATYENGQIQILGNLMDVIKKFKLQKPEVADPVE